MSERLLREGHSVQRKRPRSACFFAGDTNGRPVRTDAIWTERWARAVAIVRTTSRGARLAIGGAPLLHQSTHARELAPDEPDEEDDEDS